MALLDQEKIRYLELKYKNKDIFIVKEHRFVLKCWIKSFMKERISLGTTLFHIDWHSDLGFNRDNLQRSVEMLNLTEDDFDNFIINDLNLKNEEFIINALISTLIGDVISIHNVNNMNSAGLKATLDDFQSLGNNSLANGTVRYQITHNDKRHVIYYDDNSEDLSELFHSRCGFLGDRTVHYDAIDCFRNSRNIILDIDLDFFTYSNNGHFAKNSRDIKRQITSPSFKEILSKANVITIALEPDYCGSEEDSLEIIDVFCKQVFDSLDYEKIKSYLFDSDGGS